MAQGGHGIIYLKISTSFEFLSYINSEPVLRISVDILLRLRTPDLYVLTLSTSPPTFFSRDSMDRSTGRTGQRGGFTGYADQKRPLHDFDGETDAWDSGNGRGGYDDDGGYGAPARSGRGPRSSDVEEEYLEDEGSEEDLPPPKPKRKGKDSKKFKSRRHRSEEEEEDEDEDSD